MTLDLRSHVIKKGKGGSSLSKVSPYVRISNGSLTLYLQDGAVYSEDGKIVEADDFPEWLEGEVEKLAPEVRKVVLTAPKPSPEPKAPPQKVAPKQVNPRRSR